jgi:hypothetical protein
MKKAQTRQSGLVEPVGAATGKADASRLITLERASKTLRRIAGAEDTMRDFRFEKAMLTFVRCTPALAIAVGLIFALETVPAARAQVTVDMSKITCNQLVDR